MQRFISGTKTLSLSRLHRKESCDVRSGDVGGLKLRRWSWLPLQYDLSSVVVSDDLGSFELHWSNVANVKEFDYRLDINRVADGGLIEK